MAEFMKFSDVIVSELANSFAEAALGVVEKVDIHLAKAQHQNYVEKLRSVGVRVTTLPADEKYPDCVFVEDPAVIIGTHALITRPGAPSRFGETARMKTLLKGMGFVVMDIKDEEAKIDGGDVQFTGKEILVGVSDRTNMAGVHAVAEAFPGYRTIPIEVSGPLHLKTLISLVGEDTLCVSTESGDSLAMYKRIQKASQVNYKAIFVPDDKASNTILMNGHVFCKSESENPKSWKILQEESKYPLIGLSTSEIEKAVGSLTCLSLRFNLPNKIAPFA